MELPSNRDDKLLELERQILDLQIDNLKKLQIELLSARLKVKRDMLVFIIKSLSNKFTKIYTKGVMIL